MKHQTEDIPYLITKKYKNCLQKYIHSDTRNHCKRYNTDIANIIPSITSLPSNADVAFIEEPKKLHYFRPRIFMMSFLGDNL